MKPGAHHFAAKLPGTRSAGFQTCRAAGFQAGSAASPPAGLATRDTADLKACATTNSRRAFTLLEIMVALALFMLVMGSIFACWKSILSGTRVGQDVAAAAQRSRASMRAVEDSLVNIEISQPNIRYYYFLADTSDPQFAAVSFAARLPASFLGSDYFGDKVLRRVTFTVEKDPKDADQKLNLVMTQSPLLAIPNDQFPPKTIILARDVSAFVLEFWSPREDDWLTDFDLTNEVPPMIRVTLGTGHSARDSRLPLEVISRVVVPTTVAHN